MQGKTTQLPDLAHWFSTAALIFGINRILDVSIGIRMPRHVAVMQWSGNRWQPVARRAETAAIASVKPVWQVTRPRPGGVR